MVITFGYSEEEVRHLAKSKLFNKTIKEIQPLREIIAGYDSDESLREQVTKNPNFEPELKLKKTIEVNEKPEDPGADGTNPTNS
jgi:hypothetical protein